MQPTVYSLGVAIIALIALGRAALVHYIFVRRSLAYRKVAVSTPSSWADFIAYPEPALLFAVTLSLWILHEPATDPATVELARVGIGVVIALAALAIQIWCIRAFPTLAVGHYVLPEQQLVTKGPYAYVRHPIYALVILLWVSIAIGFGSVITGIITAVYVVPALIIYSRSEEKMLLAHFGDAYRDYRRNTGAFFPHPRKRVRVASTA
jgi:protein-S-isoprenylcysteine O-methyltransferase Ste14